VDLSQLSSFLIGRARRLAFVVAQRGVACVLTDDPLHGQGDAFELHAGL
jgi:hypothetical protein